MRETPCIRIGHLNTFDDLILGIAHLLITTRHVHPEYSDPVFAAAGSLSEIGDLLSAGKLQGAALPLPFAMKLSNAGLNLRILLLTHRSGSLILKKNSPHVNTLRDFKNKTVLVPSKFSIQTMLMHRLLASAGMTASFRVEPGADIALAPVPPAMMAEFLENDDDEEIAGICAPEPFATRAVQENTARKICTTDALWPKHPCSALVMNKNVLDNYPDAAVEIVSVLVEAAKMIHSKDDLLPVNEICRIAGTGCTEDTVRHILDHSGLSFDPDLLLPDRSALETVRDYMTDTMNVLQPEIDMAHIIDTSFIKKAQMETTVEN